MHALTTQTVIDELMRAFDGENWSTRQRYMLEQTLLNLVRLAKSEQMLEIKASVKKLTASIPSKQQSASRRTVHRN